MGLSSRVGELERAVLGVLWDLPEDAADGATVRQVHALLAPQRDIAYTTVMTVLDRLAKKGLVDQERAGRAYRYRARASRAAMTAELMREALGEFSDDPESALVAFVGEASDAERVALREALSRLGE